MVQAFVPRLGGSGDSATISGVYVVDGGAYARTRAGIAAALADLLAAGGNGVVMIAPGPDIIWDTTTIYVVNSHISIGSWGSGVNIKLPASAAAVTPIIFQGAGKGVIRLLQVDGTMLARTITLVPGGAAAAGLAARDLILIASTEPREQVTRVHSISVGTGSGGGDVITLVDQLAEDFPVGYFAQVCKLSTIHHSRLFNIRFDCNGNTGATSFGARFSYAEHCRAYDLDFEGFGLGASQGSFVGEYGYMNTWRDMNFERCGSANVTDFGSVSESRTICQNIRSDMAPGFGPGFNHTHFCQHNNISVSHAQGRALKYAWCSWNTLNNPQVFATELVPASYTGLSLTLYSHDNIVNGGLGLGACDGDLFITGNRNQINGGYFQSVYIAGSPPSQNTRLNCTYGSLVDAGAVAPNNTKVLVYP